MIPGAEGWSLALAFGLLGAVLALDDTALGQTWLSQPLPAAVLAGLVGGDPRAGLAIGVPLQLACLGNMPVGRSFLGDQVTAALAATGGLLAAGAGPGGLAASGRAVLFGPGAEATGWLLLAAVGIAAVGHLFARAERRAHLAWMLEGHRTLRDGDTVRLDRLQGRALAATALRGFLLAVLATHLVRTAWLPLLEVLPPWTRQGLRLLPLLPAFLAAGVLADRFGARQSWGWLAGGLAAGWLLARLAA